MGSGEAGAGSSALDAVESGIVLLFTERAMALASGWSAPDLVLACAAGFAAILADYPGQRIVLVTHGGVINSVLAGVLGLDEDLFFLPAHASLSTVAFRDGIGRLRSINEHRYIPEGILTL